jgi:ferritin-like metal-binding protein YciE
MEKFNSLKGLLLHEIKDLYHAEKQLIKALPKTAEKATAPDLKSALEQHLVQTEEHVNRLEQVFNLLGVEPDAETCKAMKGILSEADKVMKSDTNSDALDAAIISAAQKVEHYEIASYGTVAKWAEMMGRADIKALLGRTLAEEEEADRRLTQIAESGINQRAAAVRETEARELAE